MTAYVFDTGSGSKKEESQLTIFTITMTCTVLLTPGMEGVNEEKKKIKTFKQLQSQIWPLKI